MTEKSDLWDIMAEAKGLLMKVIIFRRAEGWYPTEYPLDYSNWQAEADRNPGTLRIETLEGEILWESSTL